MLAKVIVHEPGGFEKWLREAGSLLKSMPPAQAGQHLYEVRGCKSCHSMDGSSGTGPSFKGIYGQTHTFSNAPPTRVDDNYIRESILDPAVKIREGYAAVMPTFRGALSDEEIGAIIEFIKSLK
jgi:cytochrome c oxidase subunit 2